MSTEVSSTPLTLLGSGNPTPAAMDALANAVTSEVRLLEDLIGIMRRQRQAVATDDLQGVDDSVYSTHRVLVTLGEARRRRRSLNKLIAGTEELPLRALDDALGERMTDEVRYARDGLQVAALTLSQEVEINRKVLREALASGNEYVQAIYSSAEGGGLYGDPRQQEPEARGGMLLNRRG
jgi:hypothetical protein